MKTVRKNLINFVNFIFVIYLKDKTLFYANVSYYYYILYMLLISRFIHSFKYNFMGIKLIFGIRMFQDILIINIQIIHNIQIIYVTILLTLKLSVLSVKI